MLFAEQAELVLIDDAEFDVNPSAEICGSWLIVKTERHFEITCLIPVDTLFILAPRWITRTDAAFVLDRKVYVAWIVLIGCIWWGRHTVLPPDEVKSIRLRCGSEEQTQETKG